MALITLAALGISAGLGAYKAYQGRKQKKKGERIRRRAQSRFDANPFRLPTEALSALSSAQNLAGQTRLPGQDLIEQQISGGAGAAVQATREAATTPQDVIGGATQAYQNLYVNPLRDLGVSASNRYDANQQNLQAQLNTISQFRNQEWQQNVKLPYQAAMQTAGQMQAAGQQNMFSGISDIAGGVANFGLAGGFGGAAGAAGAPNFSNLNNTAPSAEQNFIDSRVQSPTNDYAPPSFLASLSGNEQRPLGKSRFTNNNLMNYYG